MHAYKQEHSQHHTAGNKMTAPVLAFSAASSNVSTPTAHILAVHVSKHSSGFNQHIAIDAFERTSFLSQFIQGLP